MKISVVTVSYNCFYPINGALDSVASQDYSSIEHIVVDGGSTDGTWEAIQRHPSPLIKAVSEPDQGIYDAMNKGIARSTGEVIGFLNSDDLYNPLANPCILQQIANAFADPAVGAVYGDLDYVMGDDVTRIVRHWASRPFAPHLLRQGWMPPHPTLYVRRSWFDRIGGFDTCFRIAADYDFILRLFLQPALNPVYLPEVSIKMRSGGVSNRSLGNILLKSREDFRAMRKNNVGGVGTLALKNLSKVSQFFVR